MRYKAKKNSTVEVETPVELVPVCQNCREYKDKKCGVTGEYTARKKTCGSCRVKEVR